VRQQIGRHERAVRVTADAHPASIADTLRDEEIALQPGHVGG
jgi:hypothetical protein